MEALLLKTEAGRYYKVTADGLFTRSISRNDSSNWGYEDKYSSLKVINPETREVSRISFEEIPKHTGYQILFENFFAWQRTSPIVSVEEYKEEE